jgi:hypothetical protein
MAITRKILLPCADSSLPIVDKILISGQQYLRLPWFFPVPSVVPVGGGGRSGYRDSRYETMKKIIYIILCIFFIVMLSFFTFKKNIDFTENEPNISVTIPSILIAGLFKNFEIKVSGKDSKDYINILYSSFDRPLLFFPDKISGAIIIVYFFDIEDHVFALEMDDRIANSNLNDMHHSIKRIVRSSNGFKVRYLTETELENVTRGMISMSEKDYKRLSVPAIDLGFYKFYMPKNKVLEMLHRESKK